MKFRSVIYKIISYLFFVPLLLLFINVWWTIMIFLLILSVIFYHILDSKKWTLLQVLLLIITYFHLNSRYTHFLVLLSFIFLIFQPLFLSLKNNKLKSIKVPYFIYDFELYLLTPTTIIALISLLCMILDWDLSPFFFPIIILFLLFVFFKYHFFKNWETLRKHLLYNYVLVIPIVIFFFYLMLKDPTDSKASFFWLVISTIFYLYLFLFNLPTFLVYLENDD